MNAHLSQAGLSALLLLSLACSGPSQPPSSPTATPTSAATGAEGLTLAPEQLKSAGVRTERVIRRLITHQLEVQGEFLATGQDTSLVEAPLEGRLLQIHVRPGDPVKAGQQVALLESPTLSRQLAEYHHAQRRLQLLQSNISQRSELARREARLPWEQARTRLQAARAAQSEAESELSLRALEKKRMEELLAHGIPSQQQADQARSAYQQALARHQAARDELKLATEVFERESRLSRDESRAEPSLRELDTEVSLAEEEVRHQRELLEVLGKDPEQEDLTLPLTATQSGAVTRIAASVGEHLEAGQTVVELVAQKQAYPAVRIPESRLPEVQIGDLAQVTTTAHDAAAPLSARVSWVSPQVEPTNRTAQARLQLEEPSFQRPGTYLRAVIEVRPHEALLVPDSAVTELDGVSVVYVATGPGAFQRRQVKLGARWEGYQEVLEGLQEGDECAVGGVFILKSLDLQGGGRE